MQITNFHPGIVGANTYFVVDENAKKGFIVDPGGYDKVLAKKINDEGIDVEYIILTHGHSDHICGVNEHIKDIPAAKIVAYKEEAAMLEDPMINMSIDFGLEYKVKADILVEDGDTLQIGDLKLEFLHTPGHTPGSMCIYIADEDVLFSGDTLFRLSVGRADFKESSFQELAEAIRKKLYVLPPETEVYPGHMGQTSIDFEREYNPFVI